MKSGREYGGSVGGRGTKIKDVWDERARRFDSCTGGTSCDRRNTYVFIICVPYVTMYSICTCVQSTIIRVTIHEFLEEKACIYY